MNYTITGGYVKDTQSDTLVSFGTAYDNWTTRAAIKRSRNHWLKMHREIFRNNPQLKPKWFDYKIALMNSQTGDNPLTDTQWVPEDFYNVTLPHDDRGQTFSVYTTEDSHNDSGNNLVSEIQDQFTSHIVGSHKMDSGGSFISIGAIESWFKSRPDIEPITTIDTAEMSDITEDPLNMLFNDGDADNQIIDSFDNAVVGNGLDEGDSFPMYSNDVLNTLEEVACARTSQTNPISYFTGFTALTGQVAVKFHGSIKESENIEICFEVNPRGTAI